MLYHDVFHGISLITMFLALLRFEMSLQVVVFTASLANKLWKERTDSVIHLTIAVPGDSTGTNTPTSVKPPEQEHERKQVARPPKTTGEKSPSTCNGSASKEAKEMFKNYMLNMPCVSTTGNGPNGKRIEGFLYRYQKGEEVKIMCVCHGNFLSPAEFVKHAGGAEVANPLKHIVVNPSPLLR